MSEHPIENLMNTAMNSIKDMIDVDTIIGEPIETSTNVVIIPISKVGFGFAAGGSEFTGETVNEYTKRYKEEQVQYRLPFGGGSGAGVNITPIAFLVVSETNVKLLPVNHNSCVDKLLDYVPDLIEKINEMFNDKIKKNSIDKTSEERVIPKEKEIKKEVKEERKEEIKDNHSYKPKKTKYHKPIEDYEFEYDETDDEE